MSKPILGGLSVLELGAGSVPASLAGMILADYGAHVVKVEPPGGDRLRKLHPAGFQVWNRGKESLVANLRHDDGRARVRELADRVDILIDGFSPGTINSWNLGYDEVRTSNPGIITGSVSAFSADGCFASLKAYEGVVAAKCGIMQRGQFAYRPGPIYVNLPLASFGSGLMLAGGLLSALLVRQQCGQGQHVESSMWQGLNPYDYYGTAQYQLAQRQVTDVPDSNQRFVVASRHSPKGCSRDGRWFILNTGLSHQAQAMLRTLELDYLLADERYARAPYFPSLEDADAYERAIGERIRENTSADLISRFMSEPDMAFEIAGSSEDALRHPQIVHNGNVIQIEDDAVGRITQVGPLADFSATPASITRSAPRLGENLATRLTRKAFATPSPLPEHALSGVTIIECGYFVAMPYGVTMAAALGAKVIKLEDISGDPQRNIVGAPETGAAKVMEGKESISIDLKSAAGQDIVHRLVARADVFVLGFRPGAAERLRLDYETLSKLNPKLVYIHATGYGTDGPYARRPIYAQTAQALAGSYHRYAGYWLSPEVSDGMNAMELDAVISPRLPTVAEGDANAALAVFTTIALGLYAQRMSGVGQLVRTSMVNSNLWAVADDFNAFDGKPALPLPDPDCFGLHALYRLYQARQGWIFLAVHTENEWSRLLAAISRPELARDERFLDGSARMEHDPDLAATLSEVFMTRTAADWECDLSAADIGCAEVYEGTASQFTSTEPGLLHDRLTYVVDHPTFGQLVRHGIPVKMSKTPGRVAPAVLCGQNTDDILTAAGYAPDEIESLKQAGVVRSLP